PRAARRPAGRRARRPVRLRGRAVRDALGPEAARRLGSPGARLSRDERGCAGARRPGAGPAGESRTRGDALPGARPGAALADGGGTRRGAGGVAGVTAAVAILALAWSVAAAATRDTVPYFQPAGRLARLNLAPYGVLRLRDDFVHGRPGATADLHVQQAALRAGLAWLPPRTPWRLEAGLRAALSSERNDDPWVVFRN